MKTNNLNNFFFVRDREKTKPGLEPARQNLQEQVKFIWETNTLLTSVIDDGAITSAESIKHGHGEIRKALPL